MVQRLCVVFSMASKGYIPTLELLLMSFMLHTTIIGMPSTIALMVHSTIPQDMERRKSACKVSSYHLPAIHELTNPCLDSYTRELQASHHLALKEVFEHLRLPKKQLYRH